MERSTEPTRSPARNPEGSDPGSSCGLPAFRWNDYRICIIGAASGGCTALETLVAAIPPGFPIPVVVVRNMHSRETRPLIERLNARSVMRISEARHGRRMSHGRILVAPAGRDLRINSNLRISLSGESWMTKSCPSIDVAMYSAASTLRPGSVAGILLAGMGDDGAEGMSAIRERDGLTIAENQESSAMAGAPEAAYLRGAVAHYLQLGEITVLFSRS